MLADSLDALLRGEATEEGLAPALEAKHALLTQFEATPYRPTGLAVRDQALADAIELLEWCTSLVIDCVRERVELRSAAPPERELMGTAAEVLRESGTLLVGGDGRPDLARLDALRRESIAHLQELAPRSPGFEAQARLAFHAHAIAATVLAIGLDALLVAGNESPVSLSERAPGLARARTPRCPPLGPRPAGSLATAACWPPTPACAPSGSSTACAARSRSPWRSPWRT